MNILLIEPSKSINAVIASVIKPLNVTLKTSSKVAHAKEIVGRAHKVDIVIMGSVLEDGSAEDLIDYFSQHETTARSPIYLLTSNQDREKFSHALGCGVTEIFAKNQVLEFTETLVERIQEKFVRNKVVGKILYIEDSDEEALLINDILSDNGFLVRRFSSAEDAFAVFLRDDFDLVLCDVLLSGKMTGLGLLRKIRKMTNERRNIPFIAISSDQNSARRIEILTAGANDFVAKPIVEEELMARVKNIVTNKHLLDKIKSQQAALEVLAMTDQLTGIYNRNYLFDTVPKKISEAMRHKWDCAVVVVDVDKFKTINDTHGHSVGDAVLKEVAQSLVGSCRTEDIVARFGGEEFVIVMPHCNYDDALSKADRIRLSLIEVKPCDIEVTASFGVTTIFSEESPEVTFDCLFKSADAAVYKAKDDGRNRVVGKKDL